MKQKGRVDRTGQLGNRRWALIGGATEKKDRVRLTGHGSLETNGRIDLRRRGSAETEGMTEFTGRVFGRLMEGLN